MGNRRCTLPLHCLTDFRDRIGVIQAVLECEWLDLVHGSAKLPLTARQVTQCAVFRAPVIQFRAARDPWKSVTGIDHHRSTSMPKNEQDTDPCTLHVTSPSSGVLKSLAQASFCGVSSWFSLQAMKKAEGAVEIDEAWTFIVGLLSVVILR